MPDPTTPEVSPHTQIARNYATQSENRMHSDEGARPFGFRGGLVPGIADYAYFVPSIVSTLGESWACRGWLHVKLLKPIYDGDRIEARGRRSSEDPDVLELELVGPTGDICATATAGREPQDGDGDDIVLGEGALPTKDQRPPATLELLAPGTALGPLRIVLDNDALRADWEDRFGEAGAWPSTDAALHPAFYPDTGNLILTSNVLLGPWIHVESRTRHLTTPRPGEAITVRAEVREAFERKGHEIVHLDVGFFGDDERVLAYLDHRAIVRPRIRKTA